MHTKPTAARKNSLHVIIDEATRCVVAGGFYPAETVQYMLCDLMTAVRKFGLCLRFYTDNGACYAGRHLKIVCARMKIQLVHTPPYRSQGRAKIERFFRSVREQFLAADSSITLEQINTALQKYLDSYNESWHSGLKCSPLEKRLKGDNNCRPLPVVADLEALFKMQRRCRVYKDGTVHLFKNVDHLQISWCKNGALFESEKNRGRLKGKIALYAHDAKIALCPRLLNPSSTN